MNCKTYLLFLCLLVCVLCGCQVPAKVEAPDTGLTYELIDGEAVITGDSTTLVIPQYINGCPVTRIGELSFYENTAYTAIILPQTLKTIDASAFYRCYALQEIRIPAGVSSIGANPFFRASGLQNIWVEEENAQFRDIDGVLFSKDGKTLLAYPEGREDTHYTVPDGVTAIADSAFGYHPSLRCITIPGSVTVFPDYNLFVFPEDITILAPVDSAAALYAQKHGIAHCDTYPS